MSLYANILHFCVILCMSEKYSYKVPFDLIDELIDDIKNEGVDCSSIEIEKGEFSESRFLRKRTVCYSVSIIVERQNFLLSND